MSDIIERLRDTNRPDAMLMSYPLRLEAADEIERLRGGDHHIAQLVRDLVEAKAELAKAVEALRGVVAVADRKTVEFDIARAVIAEAGNHKV